MKKIILFSFCAVLSICAKLRELTREEINARRSGAMACTYIKVIDDRGISVTNATVLGNFHMNEGKGNPFTGLTDINGIYMASGKCVGDWHYVVKKEGYYDTGSNMRPRDRYASSVDVKDGCWQPYGMTNTVVLKRKVNPVAMYTVGLDRKYTLIPKVGEPLGYDLMEGDWIAPYGKGKTLDFDVTYNRDGSGRNYTKLELVLSTGEPFAGFIKVPSDTYSKFKSPYYADTNAVYKQEMRFSFKRPPKGKGGNIDERLQESECIIMRTRTRVDVDGRLAGAYYGKIYGPMRFSFSYDAPGEMRIFHYLNPTENDPNLEADMTKNLLNPRDLNFAP